MIVSWRASLSSPPSLLLRARHPLGCWEMGTECPIVTLTQLWHRRRTPGEMITCSKYIRFLDSWRIRASRFQVRPVVANSACFLGYRIWGYKALLFCCSRTSRTTGSFRARETGFLVVRVLRPKVGEGRPEVDGPPRMLGRYGKRWWLSCACHASGADEHEALPDEVRSEAEGLQVRFQDDEETYAEGGRRRPHGNRRHVTG